MKSLHKYASLGIAATALGSSVFGCAYESADPAELETAQQEQVPWHGPPHEIYVKGKRFVLLRSDVPDEAVQMEAPNLARSGSLADQLPSSEAELAEALRPVMLDATTRAEYIMAGSNIEAARRIISGATKSVKGHPGSPGSLAGRSAPDDIEKQSGSCCGPDTRTAYRQNTNYWQATLIALAHPTKVNNQLPPLGATTNTLWKTRLESVGGSAALIGRSTALSCAHAFYTPGVGWLPTKMWGTAVDAQDTAGPIAAGYPQAYGHYRAFVPYNWTIRVNNQTQWLYDFAIMDFNEPGFVHRYPGDTAGYLGWTIASDATINSTALYNYGFPGGGGPVPIVYYPQIWGQYMSSGQHVTAGWEIKSALDTSGGTSGRPLVQYINGSYRAVGTLSGVFLNTNGTIYTRDRRFDAFYYELAAEVSDDL